MKRGALMLAWLAACTPAADIPDGGLRSGAPSAYDLECRDGIVGARCSFPGACQLGLTCEYPGTGDAAVCSATCEDDVHCPWGAACLRAWDGADGDTSRRCVRRCKADADCSCAGSRCAALSGGKRVCM